MNYAKKLTEIRNLNIESILDLRLVSSQKLVHPLAEAVFCPGTDEQQRALVGSSVSFGRSKAVLCEDVDGKGQNWTDLGLERIGKDVAVKHIFAVLIS